MTKKHKNERWVFYTDTECENPAPSVAKRVLAFCDELMCVENAFGTGAVGAVHSHPNTQITYVVSGRFRFTIDGVEKEVGPGDTMLKQNGVIHGCVCLEKGILLDVFSPMREDFA